MQATVELVGKTNDLLAERLVMLLLMAPESSWSKVPSQVCLNEWYHNFDFDIIHQHQRHDVLASDSKISVCCFGNYRPHLLPLTRNTLHPVPRRGPRNAQSSFRTMANVCHRYRGQMPTHTVRKARGNAGE